MLSSLLVAEGETLRPGSSLLLIRSFPSSAHVLTSVSSIMEVVSLRLKSLDFTEVLLFILYKRAFIEDRALTPNSSQFITVQWAY